MQTKGMTNQLRESALMEREGDLLPTLQEAMAEMKKEKFEVHKIKVKDGILKISVIDGIPEITYMTETNKTILIDAVNNNKIRMIAVGRK